MVALLNGEAGRGAVCVLKSGVVLNLNLGAVLGEVKHSYHTLGALAEFCVHGLRVYEDLSNLVAVVTDLLADNYVVGICVAANYHRDIRMLGEELVPKLVSRVVVRIVCGCVSCLTFYAERSVTLHIVVSCNDYTVVGMRGNNLVCPNENVILGSVVKAKKEVVNGARSEGVINVVYLALLVVSCDVGGISIVLSKVLVEEIDAVVTVTADKRVRNIAIHKGDSLLSGSPLCISTCLVIVCVANVYAVLGDVTKSDNVLNILGGLVVEDPLVDILEKLGVLVGNGLCVTNECQAVGIVVLDRLYVFLFPKKLLISRGVAVDGYIHEILICVLGRDLVACKKTSIGLVKRAVIISGDLLCTSHIGIKANLLDEALEVLVLTVLPILAVALCITQGAVSTDEELLVVCLIAILKNVLSESLHELAVNVATRLTARHVVNDGKMCPSAVSKVNACKSMVGGSAVSIGVCETGVTVCVDLEPNSGTVCGTVVTYDGTADLTVIVVRHIDPRLEGLDSGLKLLVDLVLTEVLNLNTATVVVAEHVAVAGIVAESGLSHSGKVVCRDKAGGGAAPGLVDVLIRIDLIRGTNVVEHSNGIDHTLEIIGIAAAVVTTDSEGVSIFGCLRNSQACGITGSLVGSVDVKADTSPTGCNNNGIMGYTAHSYISLGLIEGCGPFSTAVVLTADNDLAVVNSLDVDVGGCILAIVTDNNTAFFISGDVCCTGKLEFECNGSYLGSHIVAGIFLEILPVLGLAGSGSDTGGTLRYGCGL